MQLETQGLSNQTSRVYSYALKWMAKCSKTQQNHLFGSPSPTPSHHEDLPRSFMCLRIPRALLKKKDGF